MRAASRKEATPMAKLRLLLAAAMLGTLLLVPATASAAPPATGVTVPISGTVADVSSFVGTFSLDRIAVRNGELVALGTLSGTLTDLATGATQTVNQSLALPVAVTGTCEILHLTLGPLDLDLLGLVVHLDQVVLTIDAQQGPGNLLGNLLCAVAGLLDGGGPLAGIAQLLNQILGILALLG
jgi:hypothetical protein